MIPIDIQVNRSKVKVKGHASLSRTDEQSNHFLHEISTWINLWQTFFQFDRLLLIWQTFADGFPLGKLLF